MRPLYRLALVVAAVASVFAALNLLTRPRAAPHAPPPASIIALAREYDLAARKAEVDPNLPRKVFAMLGDARVLLCSRFPELVDENGPGRCFTTRSSRVDALMNWMQTATLRAVWGAEDAAAFHRAMWDDPKGAYVPSTALVHWIPRVIRRMFSGTDKPDA